MRQSIVILTAVFLVAAAVFLAGCTSQTTPASPTTTQGSPSVPNQPYQPVQTAQPTQAALAPNQDARLQVLILESGKALNQSMAIVAEDGQKMDMAAMQKDAAALSSQAGTYYTEIKNLQVSPEFQDIQTNYLKILQEVQTGADFYMKGAASVQSGDVADGTTLFSQGNANFDQAVQYMSSMLRSG